MRKKIKWFAKGGGIAKMGPFDTQIEAADAMRLTGDGPPDMPNRRHDRSIFPADIFVWPEYEREDVVDLSGDVDHAPELLNMLEEILAITERLRDEISDHKDRESWARISARTADIREGPGAV